MPVPCVSKVDAEFETSPVDVVLDDALRTNRPERLTTDLLERLRPEHWAQPRSMRLDLDGFAQEVAQNLSHPDPALKAASVGRRTASPMAHRVVHRRGTTAFERPHALARVLHRLQGDPAWLVIARQGLKTGLPTAAPWSWGWLWALPDSLRDRLWSAPAPWLVGQGRTGEADTDGFTPWEALVQPHAWSWARAERLADVLGPAHPAFNGGLVAAWRANNLDAQRWWLLRHPLDEAAGAITAWRATRDPQAPGTEHVVRLERQLLGLGSDSPGGPTGLRRRL